MTIQIGICDDSAEDAKMLSEALQAYDLSFKISTYVDGESLLEDFCESKVIFDILFLDIYMPGLNGIETAGKLRANKEDTKIIFISSSNEHYSEAYDVFAFNYLIKPVNKEKLYRVMDQALTGISRCNEEQIRFKYKTTTYCIFCKDIQYIESRDKIILFHMADQKTLQCYSKLDEILEQLPEKSFIRCHQSFAVNIIPITEMGVNYFCINSIVINISKKYLKTAKDSYLAYLFERLNRGI